MSSQFNEQTFTIRKKILSLGGSEFQILNSSSQVVLFSKMKAFKLKEDIRLFTGSDMQTELVNIHARTIFDASATYDVTDSLTGTKIGALQRQGLKSIIQDEWTILDANDQPVGMIKEDSTALALVRRFLTNLIPQTFQIYYGNNVIGEMKQNVNPYSSKLVVDLTKDVQSQLDRRLAAAAGVLLCAVEGKQN